MHSNFDFLASAKRTLNLESQAIQDLLEHLDSQFTQACKLILNTKGKVIVTGMGKSGHIGSKLAATLASTGTSAFFVHPGEASHGDMGMISTDDLVIGLSNSGETAEVTQLLPLLKRLSTPLISITGNPQSSLAKAADAHLYAGAQKEACPLNLAPSSSTTCALAMGDALAIALLEAKGFSAEDFAFSHPGGSLGRKLLLKVEDIMHSGAAIPIVNSQATLKEALLMMTDKGMGMTCIQDEDNLVGIFTDGDLRRAIDKGLDIRVCPISDLMTTNFTSIDAQSLAVDAVNLMQEKSINGLIVLDDKQKLTGILNMHDLLRAGVI